MRRKMALISRSEKWRKNILFAVRNAAKNGPVLGCELGRACFSRNFSRKMALFFAERNAAKNGALLLAKTAKNGAFQKKFERKKWRKTALLKRRTGFPQSTYRALAMARQAKAGDSRAEAEAARPGEKYFMPRRV
jgi:hypothetical protein